MFERKYDLKELLYENHTDLDILRQKPLVFIDKLGNHLVIEPVRYFEHPLFMKMMGALLMEHKWAFDQIDFLSHENFESEESINEAINQLAILKVGEEYEKFIKDSHDLIFRWGKVFIKNTENELIEVEYEEGEDDKERTAIVGNFHIDEFFRILLTLIYYNYFLVKKNLMDCLQVLQISDMMTGISPIDSPKREFPIFDMSKYSQSSKFN